MERGRDVRRSLDEDRYDDGSSDWKVIAFLAVVLGFLVWLSWPVFGADAPHPDHGPEHFYATWMQPDAPHVSCCSNEDCAPAQARYDHEKQRWFARWKPEHEWTEIPPKKVEQKRDMPDGRAHLCARQFPLDDHLTVLCFGAGAGS